MSYQSTKIIELGSCAFRQWKADSHCKFIHGYRLIAKFWFKALHLDEKNWVVDFGGLKSLKEILEKQFDHTLCISSDDPHLALFEQMHNTGICDLRIMDKGVGIERTSEWCFVVADTHIRDLTNNRCWVEKVEVWEHDKNSAIYTSSGDNINTYVASDITKQAIEDKPIANVVAAPAPEIQEAVNQSVVPQHNTAAAAVGNKVTTGWSNPFKGTSWGS